MVVDRSRKSFMLTQYLQAALDNAHYEIIEDEEPFYGEIPQLPGVWATGATLEACRRNLVAAVEDWLLFSLTQGLPIPTIDGVTLSQPELVAAG
jgi:predicted RNase H-like HicB family nuclease